ncbi:PA0069 family radical SAM protein [Sphingobium sp. Ant17]|jgi:DNA repair photolyase|uniref:PA0069 family radical SAM protein n=1 Tax=Sphingobium sp. Ant17 TaxID=1461752 RepID=UPI00044E54B9|nr:PA0069 family radical SAM protein [Sphingobium sp. Ant17]EXS70282.1 DNA repair photolyase [Sphingobium sp. Ant17]OHC90692.1 MAG: DNA repair photolyase [Sphingomonadales bacterium GWF1_63_6]
MTIEKGRGATVNGESARFNLLQRAVDGDWLDLAMLEGALPRLRTEVTVERPRTIIARNASPDIGFDRSINAYRGCEHGCIYCYARPSHAYHDLSPGLDFETKLFAKPDAAALLRTELARKNYSVAPIAMGTNTDPYQPIEKNWRITRQVLEVLVETRHPTFITTKSDRILCDIDLLADLARDNLVAVMISVTTLDPKAARTLEPRAPHPERRLEAIAQLAQAGIPVSANMSPIIPAINDHEIESMVARVAAAGARDVNYILVRLPHEVAPLFRAWLDAHHPDRAAKVMAIIRDLRGGRDNDPNFGSRMRGQGVWADLIRSRFVKARRKAGFGDDRLTLRTDLFRPPEGAQMRLF